MIFKHIDLIYRCVNVDCGNESWVSFPNAATSIESLSEKLNTRHCSKCENKLAIPHMKCIIDKSKLTRTMDIKLECRMCKSRWNSIHTFIMPDRKSINKESLAIFREKIKRETKCTCKLCDNRGVDILKSKVINSD